MLKTWNIGVPVHLHLQNLHSLVSLLFWFYKLLKGWWSCALLAYLCINNFFWITQFIFFACFWIWKCCTITRKWWRSNLSSVVKMMRFLRVFFFTLFLNLHKQHNILISEGIDSLQYVHCTISSPFFSLSVYYSQVVACAVCLIPAAGRTVIADETVSSSLLLSICVYSSVILCTAREERASRVWAGGRTSPSLLDSYQHRSGWLIRSASMCM